MSGTDDSPQRVQYDIKAIGEFLSKNLPTTEVRRRASTARAFTAKKFVQFLVSSDHKCLKGVTSDDDAHIVAEMLAASTEPVYMTPAALQPSKSHNAIFAVPVNRQGWKRDPLSVYVWEFRGSQTRQHIIMGSIIAVIFICCLFPVWPRWGKLAALAVSAGLLVLLLGFILFRALLGYFTWMVGYEVWILPNVFDEAPTIMELFHPYISWGRPPPSHKWYRLAMLGVVMAISYWIYTQPDEFDKFVTAQKEFVTNLYEGAFVADKSEEARQRMDGDLPPNNGRRETVEDLFDDLLGKVPKKPAQAEEEEVDPFDFEAGLDELMDED